jgi:putative oxidoreductase
MALGTLSLRLVVGGLFVGHGLQKLRGSFGGPGIAGTTRMMESLRLQPARRNAVAAALTETVGGAGVALGAATPFAGAALIGAMSTAIRKVHFKQGLWNAGGGFEYNLVLIAAVAAVVADGPGVISVDALAGHRRWGALWGIGAVAAGIAASTAVVEVGGRAADAQEAVGAAPDAAAASDGAVTESAEAARAEGLDPAETADAAI